MAYYIGGDIGATHTRILIINQEGNLLGVGDGGSGNHEGVGYEGFEAAVSKGTQQALVAAGLKLNQINGAGFGIGGYDWPTEKPRHLNSLAKVGYQMPLEIVNDTVIGIIAGSESGWGVGVVSGTGCNCWGWDQSRQKIAHLTGGGGLMGEAAGAGELMSRAVRAVSHAWSGRGPQTQLTKVLVDIAGANDVEDLLEGLMDNRFHMRAAFAPRVFETAYAGDRAAIEIIHWAGSELGEMAKTIIKQLHFETLDFDVVLIGSMWDGGPLLVDKARETIQSYAPGARMVRLNAPPVVGAILLGLEAAGIKPGVDLRRRITENCQHLRF